MYNYKAKVIKVIDGDTLDLLIDLGLNIFITERIRLYRINAYEVRGKDKAKGLKAKEYLKTLLEGKDIEIRTIKDKKGKYGRYLAEVSIAGQNLNNELVRLNYAIFKDY